MAASPKIFIFFSLLSIVFLSNAKPLTLTLTLPVSKPPSTHQYLTTIKQRTPLVSINLVVDLGGRFLWVDCEQSYVSSSYIPARCGSAQCSLAKANGCGDCYNGPKPGCNNNTCGMFPDNTITATSGELALDALSLHSTKGAVVSTPRFLFTCGSTFLLQGLANGARGMAGLGRARIGMPSLLAAAFSLQRRFSVCLPSWASRNGVVLFGNVNLSTPLMYTTLLINPVSTAAVYTQGDPSYEYFIRVKSVRVNQKPISINSTLLSINKDGVGGTKFSTVNPYTVLETSIYNGLTQSFIKEAKLTRVASVAPFEFCFDSTKVKRGRAGPAVPSIDLVLQSRKVYWRISGGNSMVHVKKGVMCFGFVNGGLNPRTSIVVGGYQLENNLMQFDLATSKLGFSQTSCSNFNFTSHL